MAIERNDIIWKDRKRFLGMPLSFSRYALSEDRLFTQTGALSLRDDELLLYRVRDISLTRSLGQRIFGVGTVTVYSSDKSSPEVMLKNVKNPYDVKELIHENVEAVKIKRRVRIGEISGDGCVHDHHDDDDFDDMGDN